MVERNNGFFETSFLPGRTFASPADFNAQLGDWLTGRANARTVRSIQGRPVDLLETDYAGDGRAAAGGSAGRADQPDPARPRLLRAGRHRRLLRRPAR